MTGIPKQFCRRVQATINDREFMVVARNAILLLLALTEESHALSDATNRESLAESLIHLWYSAFVPTKILEALSARVEPLIDAVCGRLAQTAPGSLHEGTWKFVSGNNLRLVLQKERWSEIREFFHVPEGLTYGEARRIRAATTMAPGRADYRDRWYFKDESPFMRVAKQRFREDGLLLPFGHPHQGFGVPNPLFFRSSSEWPMDDKADPLAGWSVWEVAQKPYPAAHDAYGKLFMYLRATFASFLESLGRGLHDYELYQLDVAELPLHLNRDWYDRVETANISDAGYVGTRRTLEILSPLLHTPRQNPHATVITLYLNAVMEIIKSRDEREVMPDLEALMPYLPKPPLESLLWTSSAEMYRLWDARCLTLEVDRFWEIYMQHHQFHQISSELDLAMKPNTIVEPWPTKLKSRPGQSGAQEEFVTLLGSNSTGLEHYVEWKRAVPEGTTL